jgi:antitoxin Phd
VFLERYGRRAAVLVSPERYERLMAALEDAEDVAAFDAAMNEEGANIPWDQAKAASAGSERIPDRAATGGRTSAA